MKFHLANILTLSRLVLVPVFLACFIFKFYFIAFLTFTIASFTDLVDGSVARMMKQHSQLGALLDPIADKLLMITAFSCLVSVRFIPSGFLITCHPSRRDDNGRYRHLEASAHRSAV